MVPHSNPRLMGEIESSTFMFVNNIIRLFLQKDNDRQIIFWLSINCMYTYQSFGRKLNCTVARTSRLYIGFVINFLVVD